MQPVLRPLPSIALVHHARLDACQHVQLAHQRIPERLSPQLPCIYVEGWAKSLLEWSRAGQGKIARASACFFAPAQPLVSGFCGCTAGKICCQLIEELCWRGCLLPISPCIHPRPLCKRWQCCCCRYSRPPQNKLSRPGALPRCLASPGMLSSLSASTSNGPLPTPPRKLYTATKSLGLPLLRCADSPLQLQTWEGQRLLRCWQQQASGIPAPAGEGGGGGYQ